MVPCLSRSPSNSAIGRTYASGHANWVKFIRHSYCCSCALESDDEPTRRTWKVTVRTQNNRGEVVYQVISISGGSTYLPIAYLPTAYCLLPTAYCLLPTAYCLLPSAFCLLPTAYCLLPGMGGTEYPSPYATTSRKKRLYWLCL
jgi:hypothetical protein